MPELVFWAPADSGGGGAPAFAAALPPAADGCAGRLCNYYKAVRDAPVLSLRYKTQRMALLRCLAVSNFETFQARGFSVSQFFFFSSV